MMNLSDWERGGMNEVEGKRENQTKDEVDSWSAKI